MLNLLVALSLVASISTAEAPFHDLTLDQALAAAKKDGKVVMIDFFTTWCQPCKRLDKVTWKDASVQKWLGEKTVALKMDAEKEIEIAHRYGVHSYPTITFIQPDGKKIDVIIGFKPPEQFLSLANELLAGKTPDASAKGVFGGAEADPRKRQDQGDVLAKAGKPEEALAEYLWCFDHGNEKPSDGYGDARLSSLLVDIRDLGQKHPPALRALEERRDKAEAEVLTGKGSLDAAADMAALNRVLGAQKRNLDVYDRLKAEKKLDPKIATPIVREVAKRLVEDRRYADLVEDAGDIGDLVRREIERIRKVPPVPGGHDEASIKALERAHANARTLRVDELGLWYEALLGAGKPDRASKVAEELIALAPIGSTYSLLIGRAVRADALDAARALAERGKSSLPETEKAYVEAAAQRIPAPK